MPDKFGKKTKEEEASDDAYFAEIKHRRRVDPVRQSTREYDNAKQYKRKVENDEYRAYKKSRPEPNTLRDMLGLFLDNEPKKYDPKLQNQEPDTNDNYQTAEGYEYGEDGQKRPRKSLFKKIFD